ncbi:MAG: tRNA (adenosine(37)-N6)-threonylcarbamoyltransferase complex dimerization subunit type 1 TsaB [Trueperaceae bacterium]|nr:tRNA (adenosine(37)-N6)-threonylcarbamoyltransferase complex dimerization subunit type 1 TsaB [Trueperaceae bacterium]
MTPPRLGLDTATPYLALALWWPDDGRVARASERVDRALEVRLAAAVAAFLDEHGVAIANLGGIGVGRGPGSYTGARVGVAFALGLARARGLRVVGGASDAARAAAVLADGASGWIAVEARRGTARASRWSRQGAVLVPHEALEPLPVDALPEGAAATLAVAPDAARHARAVDDPDAPAPGVRYA